MRKEMTRTTRFDFPSHKKGRPGLVLECEDLLGVILRNAALSPSSFVNASRVCKPWREACLGENRDATVARVALHSPRRGRNAAARSSLPPVGFGTMSAQCAATRAVAAPRAPAAVRRGTKSRAAVSRPASGRVGGRGVIVAATVGPPDDASVVREPRPEYIPSKIDDPNYVRVFDTTLRDGEQSPGARSRARPSLTHCPKPRRKIRQFFHPDASLTSAPPYPHLQAPP